MVNDDLVPGKGTNLPGGSGPSADPLAGLPSTVPQPPANIVPPEALKPPAVQCINNFTKDGYCSYIASYIPSMNQKYSQVVANRQQAESAESALNNALASGNLSYAISQAENILSLTELTSPGSPAYNAEWNEDVARLKGSIGEGPDPINEARTVAYNTRREEEKVRQALQRMLNSLHDYKPPKPDVPPKDEDRPPPPPPAPDIPEVDCAEFDKRAEEAYGDAESLYTRWIKNPGDEVASMRTQTAGWRGDAQADFDRGGKDFSTTVRNINTQVRGAKQKYGVAVGTQQEGLPAAVSKVMEIGTDAARNGCSRVGASGPKTAQDYSNDARLLGTKTSSVIAAMSSNITQMENDLSAVEGLQAKASELPPPPPPPPPPEDRPPPPPDRPPEPPPQPPDEPRPPDAGVPDIPDRGGVQTPGGGTRVQPPIEPRPQPPAAQPPATVSQDDQKIWAERRRIADEEQRRRDEAYWRGVELRKREQELKTRERTVAQRGQHTSLQLPSEQREAPAQQAGPLDFFQSFFQSLFQPFQR